MLRAGIINPQLLSLLAQVRHTNTLVIADAMFPSWLGLQTVDLSVIPGIPTVPQLLQAVLTHWKAGTAWMAEDFVTQNSSETQQEFRAALGDLRLAFEPHLALKQRLPGCRGLIRTGEMRLYTNIVLESA